MVSHKTHRTKECWDEEMDCNEGIFPCYNNDINTNTKIRTKYPLIIIIFFFTTHPNRTPNLDCRTPPSLNPIPHFLSLSLQISFYFLKTFLNFTNHLLPSTFFYVQLWILNKIIYINCSIVCINML